MLMLAQSEEKTDKDGLQWEKYVCMSVLPNELKDQLWYKLKTRATERKVGL